jgi:hypothetical protein
MTEDVDSGDGYVADLCSHHHQSGSMLSLVRARRYGVELRIGEFGHRRYHARHFMFLRIEVGRC